MAISITIAGTAYQLENYSVDEAATPLAGGDSSGSVGSISLTIQRPDQDINPTHPINTIGATILIDQEVRLTDDRAGVTLGRVSAVQDSSGPLIELTCVSRLGRLNVYNVQAQPFVGTLQNAFLYYASLAGVTTDVFVDESVRSRPVVFPGFQGELWVNLKDMAAAQDLDISLVSGIILLRPIRLRTASEDRTINLNHDAQISSLAQFVEVYRYDNRAITNELVYPAGGWSPEVDIITVGAGETITQELEISASLTSIAQPTMTTFVSQGHNSSSVYTIVADDGFPVPPALWAARGGSLSVQINPDTTSLTVTLTGATDVITDTGEYSKTFSVALASDEAGDRYSTLRLVGSGVAYTRDKVRIPTGVTASETGTEVGLTIDNPFLTTVDQMFRVGTRAARRYASQVPTISGSVTAVNRLGDNGSAAYPTYAAEQTRLNTPSVRTYAQVQASSDYSGKTYAQVKEMLFDRVRNEFQNQVFGNVAGIRIFDADTRRFYRVRNGTINPSTIDYSQGENDLTHGDVQPKYAGKTYAQVKAFNAGLTYKQSHLAGLIGVTL